MTKEKAETYKEQLHFDNPYANIALRRAERDSISRIVDGYEVMREYWSELAFEADQLQTLTAFPHEKLFSRSTEQRFQPVTYGYSELEMEFNDLVNTWKNEVAFTSSATDMFMNWSYQRIIGFGPVIVPLLIQELAREPDHWFWALSAVTGEDPVDNEDV